MSNKTYSSFGQEAAPLTNQDRDQLQLKKRSKILLYSLITTILLLVGLAIFIIVYIAADASDSDAHDSSDTCFTEECISTAQDILSYMDQSVNPCADFFHYACGGFAAKYAYELAGPGESQYTPQDVQNQEYRQAFLAAIFSDGVHGGSPTLNLNHSSIQKVITFYDSCYSSDTNIEETELNMLLQQFISMVNFTDSPDLDVNSEWTQNEIDAFQNAMSFLFQRRWNTLFRVEVFVEQSASIFHSFIWFQYDRSFWQSLMDDTFKQKYQELFSLNSTEADLISDLVLAFTDQVANINNVPAASFPSTIYRNTSQMNFDDIGSIFGESSILNYSQFILNVFEIDNVNEELDYIEYILGDTDYFNNLHGLINTTSPMVVQYFLYTSLFYYFFIDYQTLLLTPSITQSRPDFCFEKTRNRFKYAYAHIVDHAINGLARENGVREMSEYIRNEGTLPIMEQADWMDDASKQQTLLKAQEMIIYVGLPHQVRNITLIDAYYQPVELNETNFIANFEGMLQFNWDQQLSRFKNEVAVDLVSPTWPSCLKNTNGGLQRRTDSFLTGISAYYNRPIVGDANYFYDRGNWFVMQHLYAADYQLNYPSAINFGGLGFVVGHEINHGFDTGGMYNNWNGTFMDILSNESRADYNKRVDCFIDQYSKLQVNGINETDGTILYVNGTNTVNENIGDNAGIQEAHYAWKKYLDETNEYMDNVKLPSLSDVLTNDQLYWVGFARTRCDVWTEHFYDDRITTKGGYYWTHSPRLARIVGAVQNSQAFADAFNCPVGSPMNPEQKCVLW